MITQHVSIRQFVPESVRPRTVYLILAILAAGVGMTDPATAQPLSSSREYQIKAAMLYHFAQFTEWPPEIFAGEPDTFIVGVLGRDPFGDALDAALQGKTVEGRPVAIRRMTHVDDARGCHLLFISASEKGRMDAITTKLQDHSVLTVADVEPFTRTGGTIRLFQNKNKIRFEINREAATRAGLKLSSKLLRLATLV